MLVCRERGYELRCKGGNAITFSKNIRYVATYLTWYSACPMNACNPSCSRC